jgi:hypothetical protein
MDRESGSSQCVIFRMLMSLFVRLAKLFDLPKLQSIDRWPKEHIWQQKISAGEVIVLEQDEQIIGLIRYDVL